MLQWSYPTIFWIPFDASLLFPPPIFTPTFKRSSSSHLRVAFNAQSSFLITDPPSLQYLNGPVFPLLEFLSMHVLWCSIYTWTSRICAFVVWRPPWGDKSTMFHWRSSHPAIVYSVDVSPNGTMSMTIQIPLSRVVSRFESVSDLWLWPVSHPRKCHLGIFLQCHVSPT